MTYFKASGPVVSLPVENSQNNQNWWSLPHLQLCALQLLLLCCAAVLQRCLRLHNQIHATQDHESASICIFSYLESLSVEPARLAAPSAFVSWHFAADDASGLPWPPPGRQKRPTRLGDSSAGDDVGWWMFNCKILYICLQSGCSDGWSKCCATYWTSNQVKVKLSNRLTV